MAAIVIFLYGFEVSVIFPLLVFTEPVRRFSRICLDTIRNKSEFVNQSLGMIFPKNTETMIASSVVYDVLSESPVSILPVLFTF
jgi:hypothetical protein